MPEPSSQPQVYVVRVFCDDAGDHGNPLGVVLEGAAVPTREERQRVAHALGFSETVFIDDRERGALQIFTPAEELPLAGHPLVGTAWLLAELGQPVAELRPPAGVVRCGADARGAWIEADPRHAPAWDLQQLARPAEVDAIDAASGGHRFVWAWLDEPAGVVRARCFVADFGITEDEATGSAALRLGALLGRPIRIDQGVGSVIHAAPATNGQIRVQGRVELAPARLLPPA